MGYQMALTIIKPSSQKTSTDIGAIGFRFNEEYDSARGIKELMTQSSVKIQH